MLLNLTIWFLLAGFLSVRSESYNEILGPSSQSDKRTTATSTIPKGEKSPPPEARAMASATGRLALSRTRGPPCQTRACKQRSSLILSSIDRNVDPCDNFFKFTCGKWLATQRKKTGVAAGHATVASAKMKAKIQDLMDWKPYKMNNPNATDKIIMAYDACLDDWEYQLHALYRLLQEVGYDINSTDSNSQQNQTWEELLAEFIYSLDLNVILRIKIDSDFENSSNSVVQILPGESPYNPNMRFTTRQRNLPEWVNPQLTKFVTRLLKVVRPKLQDDDLQKLAFDVTSLTENLHKISTTTKDFQPNDFETKTVSEITRDMPNIRWLKLLNTLFGKGSVIFKNDDMVVLPKGRYFRDLHEIVSDTPPETLRNYIVWSALQDIAENVPLRFNYQQPDIPAWRTNPMLNDIVKEQCLRTIWKVGLAPIGRLYISEMFSPSIKKEIEDMVEELKEAFYHALKRNNWMDERTRRYALRKLKRMAKQVGYPDWIFDDAIINSLYETVEDLTPTSPFLTVYVEFLRALKTHEIIQLRRRVNRRLTFPINFLAVNAYFWHGQNMILVAAGILQPPFYDEGLPKYINLGSIGNILAHEMTHGFDTRGINHGPYGEYFNWWTPESRAKFSKKERCFQRQYGAIKDAETGLMLNASRTVDEDISDNSASRLTYEAFKRGKQRGHDWYGGRLPGLEDYTSDQIYFISRSLVWCEDLGVAFKDYSIRHGLPYSLPEYRVNVPLGNLPEFSDAFHCPPGSPMNFSKRCVLWE